MEEVSEGSKLAQAPPGFEPGQKRTIAPPLAPVSSSSHLRRRHCLSSMSAAAAAKPSSSTAPAAQFSSFAASAAKLSSSAAPAAKFPRSQHPQQSHPRPQRPQPSHPHPQWPQFPAGFSSRLERRRCRSFTPLWDPTSPSSDSRGERGAWSGQAFYSCMGAVCNPPDCASVLQAVQEEFPGTGFFDAPASVSAGDPLTPSKRAPVQILGSSADQHGFSADLHGAPMDLQGSAAASRGIPAAPQDFLAVSQLSPAASPDPSAASQDSNGPRAASQGLYDYKSSEFQPAAKPSAYPKFQIFMRGSRMNRL
ncbi:hypothetical protein CRENBAI_021396 [Crenichthys baileyi]|uniref:Uncharacterized protein n=1 Tax=Crenichthys baileyi TaxID=28760 RepID=A0AAV9SIX1_9TELE